MVRCGSAGMYDWWEIYQMYQQAEIIFGGVETVKIGALKMQLVGSPCTYFCQSI